MARRPVYYIDKNDNVQQRLIDFEWYPGFSITQKRKSIHSLHESISKTFNVSKKIILEISTKSDNPIGRELSAFNLRVPYNNKTYRVENCFQSSKVFQHGGPYRDLLEVDPLHIKKALKDRPTGNLVGFNYFDENWPLEPKTLFYDWLYLQGIYYNELLREHIKKYVFFTDIEFNPKKSLNCQAKSAALYVSLHRKKILDISLKNKECYKETVANSFEFNNSLF